MSARRVDVWLVDQGRGQISLWAPGARSRQVKTFSSKEVEAGAGIRHRKTRDLTALKQAPRSLALRGSASRSDTRE
eukprot:768478-Hanusia_phi.AAC.10